MNTEANNNDDNKNGDQAFDELSVLKNRARMMGISFSNNISVETLRQKIAEKTDGDTANASTTTAVNPLVPATADADGKPVKKLTIRQLMVQENMKLVRLRITNLDPKKKDLQGEILTVANEYLGTVRKFVPFGEVTDDGFHVPYCLYKMMKRRKFLSIRTKKDRRTGTQIVEQTWALEFALEVLPQLTQKDIDELKTAQAAAGSMNS